MGTHLNFHIGTGGYFVLDTELKPLDSVFVSRIVVENFDFEFLEPFLLAYLELEDLEGFMTMDMTARGGWAKESDIQIHGFLEVSQVQMIDKFGDEPVGLDRLHLGLDSFDLYSVEFDLGDLTVEGFLGLYEVFPDEGSGVTDSYTRITLPLINEEGPDTLKSGEAVNYNNPFSIAAAYVEHFAQTYNDADYKLNHFEVSKSSFIYNDYTFRDAFRYEVTDLAMNAEGIDSHD